MNKLHTLDGVSQLLAARTGRDIDFCRQFTSALFGEISQQLGNSKHVSLENFGEFFIDSEGSVTFHPAEALSSHVNEPFSIFEPLELDSSITEAMLAEGTETPAESVEELPSQSVEEAPASQPQAAAAQSEAAAENAAPVVVVTAPEVVEQPAETPVYEVEQPKAETPEGNSEPTQVDTPAEEGVESQTQAPELDQTESSAVSQEETPVKTERKHDRVTLAERPQVVGPKITYDTEDDIFDDESASHGGWLKFFVGLILGLILGALGAYTAMLYL